MSVGLDTSKYGCDGPPPDTWINDCFLLESDNIYFLGSGMILVDAGDYDADGESELLFWHHSFEFDGYELIYNRLTQETAYFWENSF